MNDSNFLINRLSEFEGIQGFKELRQVLFGVRRNKLGVEDSLERCFGRIVAFKDFRANALFRLKLYGRHEKVVKEAPFIFIEVI